MEKKALFFVLLTIVLSSCVTYQIQHYSKTSTIKDITYETILLDDAGHVKTTAYFLLEDGTLVPVSSNFNPSSTDSYIGKTLKYEYLAPEGQEIQQSDISQNPDDYSEYICYQKYSSDGKYYLKIFTEKRPAIKSIQVNIGVYSRAKEGQHILKTDIEPYTKRK